MSQPDSARRLLAPLTPAYQLALWLRALQLKTGLVPTRRLRFPAVSIGNLSTGGTGKTPLTIALANALKQRGFQVDVLSRGYGREGHNSCRVDPNGTAEQFGDEPLLIARKAGVPVYLGRQRSEAGLLAEAELAAQSATAESAKRIIHLLDDGFQHRQLARDIDILLLNRQDWQDSLLPAGNLREPLSAIRRADILAIPANDPDLEKALRSWGWAGTVWHLRRTINVPLINGPVFVFCGIARPEQFFTGLQDSGIPLAGRKVFPDHHRYSFRDVESIFARARASGAIALLTTEKDLVRLGRLTDIVADGLPVKSVGLHVEIEQEDERIESLMGRLKPIV